MFHWLKRFIAFFQSLFISRQNNATKDMSYRADARKVTSSANPNTATVNAETDEIPDYRKSDSLFTYREKVFYRALIQAADEYQVFAKVRLGDLIWIANKAANSRVYSSQLQCKHIDYVVCDRLSLEPLLAIELDDSSHQWPERRESHELKDRVCAEAELPLLRMLVEQKYEVSAVRAKIQDKIKNG